jgi:hypothetical protein
VQSEICFQTNYNLFEKYFEPVEVSQEVITEQTGFRSTKEIVESMVMAGQRLSDYRHGILDNYAEDYDEEQEAGVAYERDPVDLADAVQSRQMRFRVGKKEVMDANQEVQESEDAPPNSEELEAKPAESETKKS